MNDVIYPGALGLSIELCVLVGAIGMAVISWKQRDQPTFRKSIAIASLLIGLLGGQAGFYGYRERQVHARNAIEWGINREATRGADQAVADTVFKAESESYESHTILMYGGWGVAAASLIFLVAFGASVAGSGPAARSSETSSPPRV
jgi:hypothetical protein